MDKTELNTFYITLAAVINVSPELAIKLVKGFNDGDLEFFQSYFEALPRANFRRNNTKNESVNQTLYVKDAEAGKGVFGVVSRNKTYPFVYKKITDNKPPSERIDYLKSIYKEVIVQTLLQSDTLYGDNICTIYKVYRMGNDCVMKLEVLQITLRDRINKPEKSWTGKVLDQSALIRNILLKLYTILNHYIDKYEFHHYDLHASNVMTVQKGDIVSNLKIIDFGLSYVKIDGVEIGTLGQNLNDFYNIGVYMQGYASNISKSLNAVLDTIVDLPDETEPAVYLETIQNAKIANSGGTRKNFRKSNGKTRQNKRDHRS